MKILGICLLVVMAVFLIGCRTVSYKSYFTDEYLYARWLPLLIDSKTSRGQIVEKLGEPSKIYENGRIAVYRAIVHEWKNGMSDKEYATWSAAKYSSAGMIEKWRFEHLDAEGALLVVTPEHEVKYQKEIIASVLEFHLILVYGNEGVVLRHGLVRRQP